VEDQELVDIVERELRDLLTYYEYDGTAIPVIRYALFARVSRVK
jgi:translation elongation factor EF-Tu-like GTPase